LFFILIKNLIHLKALAKYFKSYLYFLFLAICIYSCKKEGKELIYPEIEFVKDTGFVYSDTAIVLGTAIKIGVFAKKSDANITYLTVKVDNGILQTALDSGMNSGSFYYTKNIIKSNSQSEIWSFTIMDKNRVKSSSSLKITKKAISSYGEIFYFPSVILGAQNCSSKGNFYSLTGNMIYNQQEAFNNQSLIDMIYYYGAYNATISSPGETEVPSFYTGITGIANWTIKNTTYYDTTMVTEQQFDLINNDSLILVQYDQLNGKKKAKYLQAGMVVSFVDHLGKIGLLKVAGVNGTDTGTLEIAVKIQK
jgi:hypothetical protein